MAELTLTPKERQQLKGRAHGLDPVVLLGAGGLSPAVVKEIDRALDAHELIKVRVPGGDRDERDALFLQVAEQLSAARVQSIGKLLVLFRPRPEDEPPAAPAVKPRGPGVTRSRKAPPPLPKKAAGQRGAASRSAPPPARPQRGEPPPRVAGKGAQSGTRSGANRSGAKTGTRAGAKGGRPPR